jgi:hypothetical protein
VESSPRRLGGRLAPVLIAAALALAFVATPLALHFGQKRHDRLPFEVDSAYPPGGPPPNGAAFADTLAALVEHELESPTGWRPNDFVLWGPGLWADNNANRQLGIIQAVRESARVFRDNLTKVSGTEYDPNLVDADTRLRNDERKFWFPSAERRFAEGVEALRRYVAGLRADPPTSKPLNRRNVEAIRLFTAWTDLLGGAHAELVNEEVGFFHTDDVFYRAQGLAHVMHHLARAVRREYETELQQRPTVIELLDRVITSLGRAGTLKPLIVVDASPDGIWANHRRNLDAYLVDARQLLYSVREELEK